MSEPTGIKALLQIEERGIEPVPEAEQTSRPTELFWIWFAANISILGLPLGAWVVAGELNLWQALAAAFIGAVGSFAIVGIVSVAGQRGGAPSLTLSRATFGSIGNYGPTIIAIISRWGWETVNAVTAASAILAIGAIGGGSLSPKDSPVVAVISVVVFLLLTLAVSGLGHSVLAFVQRWSTYVFGALTVVVLIFLLFTVEWGEVFATPAGSMTGMLLGIGTVAAGTGIAWANSGADIGRYQDKKVPGGRLVQASALGAGIPLVIMIGMGSLINLTSDSFDLDNPLSSIPALLPPWMSIPFLIAAFAGVLMSNNISVYSSGLTLLTLGLKVRRIYAVAGDLVVSLIGSMIFMFLLDGFYGPFIDFISLLAIPLTAWLGVFLVDMIRRRTYSPEGLLDMKPGGTYWYTGGVEWRVTGVWLISIVVGYLFIFVPGLTDTFIGVNNLGWLLTMLLAMGGYALLGGAKGYGTPDGSRG